MFSLESRAQNPSASAEEIRTYELRQQESVRNWSLNNNFPVRIDTQENSSIELIDVVNNVPVFFTTQNHLAGQLTGAVYLHPAAATGFDLTGNGVRIGIWDAGAVYVDHQELRNRSFLEDMGDASNHATHVAGTLIAKGIDNAAQGMAPPGLTQLVQLELPHLRDASRST